jgi:hypothetical protein
MSPRSLLVSPSPAVCTSKQACPAALPPRVTEGDPVPASECTTDAIVPTEDEKLTGKQLSCW